MLALKSFYIPDNSIFLYLFIYTCGFLISVSAINSSVIRKSRNSYQKVNHEFLETPFLTLVASRGSSKSIALGSLVQEPDFQTTWWMFRQIFAFDELNFRTPCIYLALFYSCDNLFETTIQPMIESKFNSVVQQVALPRCYVTRLCFIL